MSKTIESFIHFIEECPTAWHASAEIAKQLRAHNFTELQEGEKWKIKPGGAYFVQRNGSSLGAFIVPKHAPESLRILGSHTDSPSFKVKPNAEYTKENMVMLGVEIYGGPLLTSWLNRDLAIAGRIIYQDSKKKVHEALVRLDAHPLTIPQLAIHLDRNVNENGLVLNKQEHLAALAALKSPKSKGSYLEMILKEQVSFHTLLSHELFLYPLEKPRLIGSKGEMLASYRIDNLGGAHAVLQAIAQAKVDSSELKMAFFWDNEEIGSHTAQGAGSPFLPDLLERITLSLGLGREDYLRLVSQGLCVSVDLCHALHPNYSDKHEPRHQLLMQGGIALKSNAQYRYASDARTMGLIVALCKKLDIPVQKFVSRNDIPSGSTIGPIAAHLMGMPTVDIGYAQLSMHSCRELVSCQDHESMCKLLKSML